MKRILVILFYLTTSFGKTPPNIVIFLADDLGYNDISWHNQIVRSPNLARLAADGVLLEQYYTQSVCSPARGSLLTGRYPIHTGLSKGAIKPLTPYGLLTNVTTLAEVLSNSPANYSTHIVGKWHLGFCRHKFLPTNRGFHHHYGFWCGAGDYYQHTRSYGHKRRGYDFREDMKVNYDAKDQYTTHLLRDRGVKIIREHNQSQPLFLYVPFQAIHSPKQVPFNYSEIYQNITSRGRQKLLGMVTALDEAVGDIVTALEDEKMMGNTIIIFASDNGGPVPIGASNWPLRGGKSTLWEGGTRVPAFITAKGLGVKSRIEQGLVHVTDWFPTILEASGLLNEVNDIESLDGVSHWASLLDRSKVWARREILYNIRYTKYNNETGEPEGIPKAALRQGDWKFIWRLKGLSGWYLPWELGGNKSFGEKEEHHGELYNLAKDPEERVDMAGIETEKVEVMKKRIEELAKTMIHVRYKKHEGKGSPRLFGEVWSTGWCEPPNKIKLIRKLFRRRRKRNVIKVNMIKKILRRRRMERLKENYDLEDKA